MICRSHTAWLDLALLLLGLALCALLIGVVPSWDGWRTHAEAHAPSLYSRADLQKAFEKGYRQGHEDAIRAAGWPVTRIKDER